MVVETYTPSYHEICTKVNNAKDKPAKIKVLKKHRTEGLEMFLKSALDSNIEWLVPEGDVPYIQNEAPEGTEHTQLAREIFKCHNFVKLNREYLDLPAVIGNPQIKQLQREQMFIQLLEGLHKDEARILIWAKDKEINKRFKGLNANTVREAYGWDQNFQPA